MSGKSKISRYLFAGAVTTVFAAAFLAFSPSAGALERPLQLEGGINPIEFPAPREPEDPDEDGGLDLPEPQDRQERPEPISPVAEPQEPEFACPECGADFKIELEEVEDLDDGSNDGNPDNLDDNPFELPEPDEDEPEEDEFTVEFPEREEPEGEPVDIVDVDEAETVKPAFECPGCDGKYELELLMLAEPEEPEVPEPEAPIEIPEPDDEDEEDEFEIDIDDLLD